MWLVELPADSSNVDFDAQPIGSIGYNPAAELDWVIFAHKIIAFLFVAGGFFCLLFLLWGGIQYITSGGQEEKIKKATSTVRNALIGLIIIILSVTAIALVGKVLNRDLIPYLNFQTIVEQVNTFAERL